MTQQDHMAFLKQAQDFADVWGDSAWFHQVYTGAREHHGVWESAECALRAQDLLRDFMFTHYPDRLISGCGRQGSAQCYNDHMMKLHIERTCMNQLVLAFAHEAGLKSTWEQAVSPAEQRFADLIVEKCCAMMMELEPQYPANLTVREIKKTFGVEA